MAAISTIATTIRSGAKRKRSVCRSVSIRRPIPITDQVVHRFKGHANEAVLINAFRNPIELMLAVGSFCAGGVLERFPKLARGLSRRQLQLAALGALSLGRTMGAAQGLLPTNR